MRHKNASIEQDKSSPDYGSLRTSAMVISTIGDILILIAFVALVGGFFLFAVGASRAAQISSSSVLVMVGIAAAVVALFATGIGMRASAERMQLELDNADNLADLCADVGELATVLERIEANTGRTAAALERLTARRK